MPEQEFVIRAFLEFEYRVKADNADEAEQLMEDGELVDKGECVGYSVDSVVSSDKRGDHIWQSEDDLRERCKCGHLVFNEHEDRKCRAFRCDCLMPIEAVAS